jgi:hypothetical protein
METPRSLLHYIHATSSLMGRQRSSSISVRLHSSSGKACASHADHPPRPKPSNLRTPAPRHTSAKPSAPPPTPTALPTSSFSPIDKTFVNHNSLPNQSLHKLKDSHPTNAKSQPNFYQNAIVEKYAANETQRVTLRQLTVFGRHLTEEKLLKSANYVREELSVRLAHRIRGQLRAPPSLFVVTFKFQLNNLDNRLSKSAFHCWH